MTTGMNVCLLGMMVIISALAFRLGYMVGQSLLMGVLKELLAEYEDQRAQFGNDPIWRKYEDISVLRAAKKAIGVPK